ncbi:sortase [Actinomadura sp. 6N118]|uniref:sortase n=1 Tax=Actinomadura sp. 6N118 TaxID=3375151 RepID=UPI0037BD65DC
MSSRLSLRFLWTAVLFTATVAVSAPQAVGDRTAASTIATLVIPRIGLSERVREGVAKARLRRAIGHYPGTAKPGQPGNVALLGHRTTGRAPFRKLNRLTKGDLIIFKIRSRAFRYVVRRIRIISPSRTNVLHPVPFRAGRTPKRSYVSLITCHPMGSDAKRLVVIGELVATARAPYVTQGP